MCIYKHTYICIHLCTYTYVHIHVFFCVFFLYSYKYAYIYTYMNIYAYRQIPSLTLSLPHFLHTRTTHSTKMLHSWNPLNQGNQIPPYKFKSNQHLNLNIVPWDKFPPGFGWFWGCKIFREKCHIHSLSIQINTTFKYVAYFYSFSLCMRIFTLPHMQRHIVDGAPGRYSQELVLYSYYSVNWVVFALFRNSP